MTDPAEVSLEGLAELLAASASAGTTPTDAEAALQALEAVVHIERSSQTLLANSVAAARARGASWQAIGTVLSISRQAAFKRFSSANIVETGQSDMSKPLIDLASRTEEVFRHLSQDDYASVKALMTFTCSRVLTRKKVMGVWSQVVADTGRFENCSHTTIQTADGSNVATQKLNQHLGGGLTGQTQLNHEAGEWLGRVAYNGAGKITGLLIVHPLQANNLPF